MPPENEESLHRDIQPPEDTVAGKPSADVETIRDEKPKEDISGEPPLPAAGTSIGRPQPATEASGERHASGSEAPDQTRRAEPNQVCSAQPASGVTSAPVFDPSGGECVVGENTFSSSQLISQPVGDREADLTTQHNPLLSPSTSADGSAGSRPLPPAGELAKGISLLEKSGITSACKLSLFNIKVYSF